MRLLFSAVVVFILFCPAIAGDWYELVRKIENPRGPIHGSGDEFGISLAQVGQNFIVGVYRDDTGAENAGIVYIYDRNGQLLTTIRNPTPQTDDWFGFEVGSVQDKVLIGARNNRPTDGAVYVYEQDGTLVRTIENPTPSNGDQFGFQVMGHGDNILITAREDDTAADDGGAAYLYDLEGTLLQHFFSPNPVARGRFGRPPASFGTDAFLTSSFLEEVEGERVNGSTYLFNLSGNHLLTLSNPKPEEPNLFGGAVITLSGERVLVTAYDDRESGINAGAAYIFDSDGVLLQTIVNPTPARDDWFGRTLTGVGHDMFLIGSVFDDTLGENAGAAYLYDSEGSLLQTFLPPEPVRDGHFSLDLATVDDLILIGSHFDGGGFTGPGAVYVFAPLIHLLGDYTDDDVVDQADLDLVLINWGTDGTTPPSGWVSNLPTGLIDQAELDQVLINWGQTRDGMTIVASTPEPATWHLAFSILATVIATQIGKPVRRHYRSRE